jgi:hypothetical protein
MSDLTGHDLQPRDMGGGGVTRYDQRYAVRKLWSVDLAWFEASIVRINLNSTIFRLLNLK